MIHRKTPIKPCFIITQFISESKMFKIVAKYVSVLLLVSLLINSCKKDDLPLDETNPSVINLHYYQNDSETKQEFEKGIKWAFSFLGAELKTGSWEIGVTWINEESFRVDFSKLGFSSNGIKQLNLLIQQFVLSEEYIKTRGIDAGRFITSILNNSNHYYKIVGMPETLDGFNASSKFLSKKAAIIESAVALKERIINLPLSNAEVDQLKYWAEELSGSLKDSTEKVEENEVMDIMSNGQLRFGIYNKQKELIGGSDASLTIAGKPAKCLWCHETSIQKGFAAITEIPGYYSPNQFDSIVDLNNIELKNYRNSLDSEIDFNDRKAHTDTEKLYIRYFEPSAKRLSKEWSLSIQQVESLLQNIPTHIHDEFPEFGNLYHRDEIQSFSPYQVLPSAASARETVSFEIDLLP